MNTPPELDDIAERLLAHRPAEAQRRARHHRETLATQVTELRERVERLEKQIRGEYPQEYNHG